MGNRQPLHRSSYACKLCNSRRIKCDVSSIGVPCSRCKKAGSEVSALCVIVQSNRGKTGRSHKNGGRSSATSSRLATAPPSAADEAAEAIGNVSGNPVAVISPDFQSSLYAGETSTNDLNRRMLVDDENEITAATTLRELAEYVQPLDSRHRVDQNGHQSVAEDASNSNHSPLQNSSGRDRPTESTRLWEKLLDTDPTLRTSIRDAGQMAYLGESFPVSYFLQNYASTSVADGASLKSKRDDLVPRLHFQVGPPSSSEDSIVRNSGVKAPDGHVLPGGQSQLEYLYRNGCFETPSMQLQNSLFEAYFEYFHPLYPIINCREFSRRYVFKSENKASLLLLWAILFIGATHCPEEFIRQNGYEKRTEARDAFFQKGKLLYDAGYETDSTTLVQTLFIFGFRWCDPADDKGSYHWSGAAINLAISIGMHRSTASAMNPDDRRLWRRIWWSIYYRDRQNCSNLGRPIRTYDHEIDIEPLSEGDFETDSDISDIAACCGKTNPENAALVLNMVRLSKLIPQLVACRYAVQRNETPIYSIQDCDQLLTEWESQLPDMFRSWNTLQSRNLIITLHRSTSPQNTHPDARAAAKRIAAIVGELIESETLRTLPYHGASAIFAAVAVTFVDKYHAPKVHTRKFSQQRYDLLVMALKDLQQHWPVTGWFLGLVQRLEEKFGQTARSHFPSPAPTPSHGFSQLDSMMLTPNAYSYIPNIRSTLFDSQGMLIDVPQTTIHDDLFGTMIPFLE